jgi:hypothetical protein
MADSGGHWLNLAEVQKLTQSELLPGIIDESPKRGGLIDRLPIRQAMGKSLLWNRSDARRSGRRANIGDQLAWSDNVTYVQKETSLKIFYDQTPLNKFVEQVYGTVNNYEAQQLLELRTGIVETVEDSLLYDDNDYDSTHITGMHHWAVDNTGTDGDIDEGEGALSFQNLRTMFDYAKYGITFLMAPFILVRYIDQFYQEGGPSVSSLSTVGSFLWSPNDRGMPTPWFRGTEILRSDFMVGEQANTGQGSDARAKNTSGAVNYSMLGILTGSVGREVDPGVTMGFGGEGRGAGEIFKTVRFDDLEDYDAAGLRLVSYMGMYSGSQLGVNRIHDITALMPTA